MANETFPAVLQTSYLGKVEYAKEPEAGVNVGFTWVDDLFSATVYETEEEFINCFHQTAAEYIAACDVPIEGVGTTFITIDRGVKDANANIEPAD